MAHISSQPVSVAHLLHVKDSRHHLRCSLPPFRIYKFWKRTLHQLPSCEQTLLHQHVGVVCEEMRELSRGQSSVVHLRWRRLGWLGDLSPITYALMWRLSVSQAFVGGGLFLRPLLDGLTHSGDATPQCSHASDFYVHIKQLLLLLRRSLALPLLKLTIPRAFESYCVTSRTHSSHEREPPASWHRSLFACCHDRALLPRSSDIPLTIYIDWL